MYTWILCIDIVTMSIFRYVRRHSVIHKLNESERFILYMLYAWIIPILITGIAFLLEHFDVLPDDWETGFDHYNQWFPCEKL